MSLLWYASRGTGEVALLLLTAAATLGALSAARIGGRRVPRFVVTGLHRNLTLVALVFLAVHVCTAVGDSFARLRWHDAVVPFTAGYRPLWVGLGAVAFDLLVALTVTSLVRARLGLRLWRALHWAAYVCWTSAVVHALGTGTDTRTSLALLLAGGCAAVFLTAVAVRITAARPERPATKPLAVAALAVGVFAMVFWTVTGPLAPGWARRAGTPVALLGGGAAAAQDTAVTVADRTGAGSSSASGASAGSSAAAEAARLRGTYSRALTGTLDRADGSGPSGMRLTARFTAPGGLPGVLQVRLYGAAETGEGAAGEAAATGDGAVDEGPAGSLGRVSLGTTDRPALFTGPAHTIGDGRIEAVVTGPDGDQVRLRIDVALDDRRVTGELTATSAIAGRQEEQE